MANSNKTVFPDPVGALHTNDSSVFVSINSIISLCIALKDLFLLSLMLVFTYSFDLEIFLRVFFTQKHSLPPQEKEEKKKRISRVQKKKRKRKQY